MDYKDLVALQKPTRNQTDVAIKITKQLFESEFKDKNLIYSPLSIHIVLSLIAARTNSQELLSFLNSESINDLNSFAFKLVTSVLPDSPCPSGPRLNLANGLWVDESSPLEESYKKVVIDSYKAALNEVDIKSDPEKVRIEVNKWVEEQTKGLIPQIHGPGSVHNGTSTIYANALYFKAAWLDIYHFHNPRGYEDIEFHLMNGDAIKRVPFMTSLSKKHSVAIFDDFKVLSLDYRRYSSKDYSEERLIKYHDHRSFSMLWLLPDARDGLPALAARVCSDTGFLRTHLDKSFETVRVKKFLIPKLKISSGFEVSGVLRGEQGMCGNLMDVYHKAVIEVDEKGTEAAAWTCLVGSFSMGDPPPEPREIEEFVADHPFMFLVRENRTGTVLFVGKVMNPLEGVEG